MRARIIPVLALALGAGLSTNALVASNTVPTSTAGSGAGTISGYVATAVAYTLNTTTPTDLDAVLFTLDAAATTVKVKLTAAGSTFYSCTNTSGNNWSCATTVPQATVAAVDQLTIAAAQ